MDADRQTEQGSGREAAEGRGDWMKEVAARCYNRRVVLHVRVIVV